MGGEILLKTSDYVFVKCKPGRKLVHHTKNDTFTINNTSLEYFSLKEWFTAAILLIPIIYIMLTKIQNDHSQSNRLINGLAKRKYVFQ